MSVRLLLPRLPFSRLGEIRSQIVSPKGQSWFFQETVVKRWIKTLTESVGRAVEGEPDLEPSSSEGPPVTSSNAAQYRSVSSNLKVSGRHDTAMFFTCNVCETRSVKTICRESYEKGVVVVRCGGCNNFHLIADRLGWFGEPGSVEDLLAARGEEVKKGSVDTLNLTLEDLLGTKSP